MKLKSKTRILQGFNDVRNTPATNTIKQNAPTGIKGLACQLFGVSGMEIKK